MTQHHLLEQGRFVQNPGQEGYNPAHTAEIVKQAAEEAMSFFPATFEAISSVSCQPCRCLKISFWKA